MMMVMLVVHAVPVVLEQPMLNWFAKMVRLSCIF